MEIEPHCKKEFAIFPSPAGMSLTKLSLAEKLLTFFYCAEPPLSEPNKEELEREYELMIEKIYNFLITCS